MSFQFNKINIMLYKHFAEMISTGDDVRLSHITSQKLVMIFDTGHA